MDPNSLEEVIQRSGLEALQRFYGPYWGVVTRNDDPEGRGRIQAHVKRTMGNSAMDFWIDPIALQSGPNRGFFWPPEVGDSVSVYFDNGGASRPRGYLGGWFTQSGQTRPLPSEFAYTKQGTTVLGPDKRGFVTRAGHTLVFDDTKSNEAVSLTWHQPAAGDKALTDRKETADRSKGKTSSLLFEKDGSVQFANANGTKVRLDTTAKSLVLQDEHGNKITLSQTGIEIESVGLMTLKGTGLTTDFSSISLGKGAVSPAVKGDGLAAAYQPHTHIAAAPGAPTSTPVPPLPPSVFSTVVKIK